MTVIPVLFAPKELLAVNVPPPENAVYCMLHQVHVQLFALEMVARPFRGPSLVMNTGVELVPVVLVKVVMVNVLLLANVTVLGAAIVSVAAVKPALVKYRWLFVPPSTEIVA